MQIQSYRVHSFSFTFTAKEGPLHKMKSILVCCWLLIFSLGINGLFSATITDVLCTTNPNTILICDNTVNELDSGYYSCYTEIFTNGNGGGIMNLSIGECRGPNLDPRIPDVFKNLTQYNISHHGIETLSPDDLRFDYLQTFDASFNKLTFIQAGLFQNAPRLTTIDLPFNNITAVESGAFSELSDLKIIILRHNPIRRFDGQIFLPISFEIDVFSLTWDNIEEFDISHMKGVYEFGFTDAPIDYGLTIQKRDPTGAHVITTIYERSDFEKIKYFNVSATGLQNVSKLIELLGSSIQVLDVSSNFIGELNESVFDKLNQLHYLNLSNTELSSISFRNFQHPAVLKVLDISCNNLKKMNFTSTFGNFENLETINLFQTNSNMFGIFNLNRLKFPKLKTLGLSKYQFANDVLEQFRNEWPNLHLVYNSLAISYELN